MSGTPQGGAVGEREWTAVAPLVSYLGDPPMKFGRRFDLGMGVSLERDISAYWKDSKKDSLTRDEKFCFERASASLVYRFTGLSLEERPEKQRTRAHMTRQDVAVERLHLARLAVFLIDPGALWFFVVGFYGRDGGDTFWWDYRHVGQRARGRPQNPSELSRSVLAAAKPVLKTLCGPVRRTSSLWAVLQLTYLSLDDQPWLVGYLELWTALEALFAPDRFWDTSFWLCLRIAAFPGGTDREIQRRFKLVYDWYDLRSRIVHGTVKGHGKRPARAYEGTEEVLRTALRKILMTPKLRRAFSGRTKEAFLASGLDSGWKKAGKGRKSRPVR